MNKKYLIIIAFLFTIINIKGFAQSTSLNNERIYHYLDLDKIPTLKDGVSIQHYINSRTVWPNGFHGDGKVYMTFVVDTVGKCKDVRIIKSLTKECDILAISIINSMPKLIPGEIKSKNVNTLIFTYVDFTVY